MIRYNPYVSPTFRCFKVAVGFHITSHYSLSLLYVLQSSYVFHGVIYINVPLKSLCACDINVVYILGYIHSSPTPECFIFWRVHHLSPSFFYTSCVFADVRFVVNGRVCLRDHNGSFIRHSFGFVSCFLFGIFWSLYFFIVNLFPVSFVIRYTK